MQVEDKLKGSLLDAPKSMLLQDGGSNLCLCLEDISPGWKCKPLANYQVFLNIFTYCMGNLILSDKVYGECIIH